MTRSVALQDATGVLVAGCFLRDTDASESPSVVCTIAAPAMPKKAAAGRFAYTLSMAATRFGLPAGGKIEASDLLTGEVLGAFDPTNVTITGALAGFDAVTIKLAATTK